MLISITKKTATACFLTALIIYSFLPQSVCSQDDTSLDEILNGFENEQTAKDDPKNALDGFEEEPAEKNKSEALTEDEIMEGFEVVSGKAKNAGKAAAELLIRFMGPEGKVALLTGVPGAFNLEERIRGFITHINRDRDTTVILTTHDLSDVEKLCERVMIIDRGKLLFDGQLETLRNRFGGKRELVVDLNGERPSPEHRERRDQQHDLEQQPHQGPGDDQRVGLLVQFHVDGHHAGRV